MHSRDNKTPYVEELDNYMYYGYLDFFWIVIEDFVIQCCCSPLPSKFNFARALNHQAMVCYTQNQQLPMLGVLTGVMLSLARTVY